MSFIQGNSQIPVFDTLQDAIAADLQPERQTIKTQGYHTLNDGGAMEYRVVPNGTGTNDGGSYVGMVNGNQLEAVFPEAPISIILFGAKGDGTTDDLSILNQVITYSSNNNKPVSIPEDKTVNISAPATLLSNVSIVINGAIKLNDAAVSDSDVGVLRNTSDASNIAIMGTGIIQGPASSTRRAVGLSIEKITTETKDIYIGSGLHFKDLLIGIFLEEVENAIVGDCFYDTMFGTNAGGASQSGACISIAGGNRIVIGSVNGVDIYKSAMQFTASGPSLQIPSNISVGDINIQGPATPALIPEGLGLRAGKNINISSINVEDVDYAALLSAESNHEYFQDISIGTINGTDMREIGVLIRDIRGTPSSNCERVNIGRVSVDDCGDEAFRAQAVDDIKVGVLNANNVGTIATAPGLSGSDAENLQFGDIHINTATGDGINLLRCRDFKASNVRLESVGTAGAGYDGVLVLGNSGDADRGCITSLTVTGGAYDYAVNTSQQIGAEFTVEMFWGESGTADFFNQSVNYLLGGKSMQGNFDGAGQNMPMGSVRRLYTIINAFIVSDTAIAADGANFHTIEIRDVANNILATVDSSATAWGQYANIPMTISLPFGGGVFTSFRIVHNTTGSPTAITTFSVQMNYYDNS